MTDYKLLYFNLRARGEFIRYMFHYASVPFKDERISEEQWMTIKPTTPFGHIPVLFVDGKPLANSTSIGWYLGQKFGLSGKTEMEQIQAKMVVNLCEDFNIVIDSFLAQLTEILKSGIKEKLMEFAAEKQGVIAPYLIALSGMLSKNGNVWFVRNEVTYADLMVAQLNCSIEDLFDPRVLDLLPSNLRDHYKRVNNLPGIKEYIATRPQTVY